ncbi:nucleolar protein 12-domain-containing protein [Scheffersomyces coipomensis]|uniref:nucleolar protein 12-domain-containing protein n=1 Tax=Scheffersomyces coipomensis TaxID=1788519 RepID=UPI00315C4BCC
MAGPRKNRDILTGGKRYAEKAAKKHAVDEVVFDKDSREEYLTGFHKRKLQRQKKAQEYIKEQERIARVDERKKMRDERKKDLENQLKQFQETVKKISTLDDSDDEEEKVEKEEWKGFKGEQAEESADDNDDDDDEEEEKPVSKGSAAKPLKGILHHTEIYTIDKDEPVYAYNPNNGNAIIDDETEVVVESLDNPAIVSAQEASLAAIAKLNNVNLEKSEEILEKTIHKAQNYAKVVQNYEKKQHPQKKKKFRYLTKGERRENTRKERYKGNSKKERSKDKAKDKGSKDRKGKK